MHNRYDIERFTNPLRQYVEDGRDSLLSTQMAAPRSGLSAEVLHTMGDWIKTTKTTFLCIEGYAPPGTSSMLSVAAMQLCDIALDARLPCLSFFCNPMPKHRNPSDLTDKQAGLISFLYSIILQLTQLLPVEFEASTDFTEDRYKQFNGAFSTVSGAIELIDDLTEQLDGMMHWILDGINLIEDRDTRPHILQLIEMLRRKGQRTPCKVCFTISGNSMVLNRALTAAERMGDHIHFTRASGRVNHGVGAEAFRHVISRPTSPNRGLPK